MKQAIAEAFLAQIKEEFENNETLKSCYRDVLYDNPRGLSRSGQRPKRWSVAAGITVKRKSNPKEATIEAHGLVDGQPTSRHFDLHIYDDVVTQDTISEDMIRKTTERFELADNLGTHEGVRKWMVGTRYHYSDTYATVLQRGSMKARIYPATHNGKLDGRPVFLDRRRWEQIKRDQRSTVAAQCLLNPVTPADATFTSNMLHGYDVFPDVMNVYILVDPSKGSTARSDRTAIAVIGLDHTGRKYLLDGYRHRMALTERFERVVQLKRKWTMHPGVKLIKVGWERYGKDAEIEAINEMQRRSGEHFHIYELNTPRHGSRSKKDRIERLEPDFRGARFFLPGIVFNPDKGGRCTWSVWTEAMEQSNPTESHSVGEVWYQPLGQDATRSQRDVRRSHQQYRMVDSIKRKDEDGNIYDLTRVFIDEFLSHPFATHDDLIDAVSRIYDIDPRSPDLYEEQSTEAPDYFDYEDN